MDLAKKFFAYLGFLGITILALYLIKILDISYPLTITSTATTRTATELAVVGEGKVEAKPDIAYIDAGISVQNEATVEAAQRKIDETNNKIIAAMKALGIKTEDIKTSNYSIHPNYSYKNDKSTIAGYNGSATVTIKIRNLSLVSKVITEATVAGANNVGSSRFAIDNTDKYREEARNLAIANAKAQAEKLAAALGLKLGRIVNIVESSPRAYYDYGYGAAEKSSAMPVSAPPVIEPGTQTVTSTVTLYFEKK